VQLQGFRGGNFNDAEKENTMIEQMRDEDGNLTMTNLGNDTAGKPIFEIGGDKYFYQGKHEGDHVWLAESGRKLVFKGPDYSMIEHHEAPSFK
jgi:hypothetical protein